VEPGRDATPGGVGALERAEAFLGVGEGIEDLFPPSWTSPTWMRR
jgi:hypothetical protein